MRAIGFHTSIGSSDVSNNTRAVQGSVQTNAIGETLICSCAESSHAEPNSTPSFPIQAHKFAQNFRMLVDAGHQPQSHGSPNSLSQLPLVHRPQPSVLRALDATRLCDELTKQRKILVVFQRVRAKQVENITLWSPAHHSVFRRFDGGKIVRCVYLACRPATRRLALKATASFYA